MASEALDTPANYGISPEKYLPMFPYFGGKKRVAAEVWERFGEVRTYTEPFFGSGAVLLSRPAAVPDAKGNIPTRYESVNDADCFLSNFWRAVKLDPDTVAQHADYPSDETHLFSTHMWLLREAERVNLGDRLIADPEFFDAKIAGRWVWGACWWIGSGWCSGDGPWRIDGESGVAVRGGGPGVVRQRQSLRGGGPGVVRELQHLGGGGPGACVEYSDWIRFLVGRVSDRLRRVRAVCGDWSRACTPAAAGYTPSNRHFVGVFLDPPYSLEAGRDMGCYSTDCGKVAHDVRGWCVEHGSDSRLRIALCGYEGEHEELERLGWSVFAWKSNGMGNAAKTSSRGKANETRERIWFSPACL